MFSFLLKQNLILKFTENIKWLVSIRIKHLCDNTKTLVNLIWILSWCSLHVIKFVRQPKTFRVILSIVVSSSTVGLFNCLDIFLNKSLKLYRSFLGHPVFQMRNYVSEYERLLGCLFFYVKDNINIGEMITGYFSVITSYFGSIFADCELQVGLGLNIFDQIAGQENIFGWVWFRLTLGFK